jgi:hypothetical protein
VIPENGELPADVKAELRRLLAQALVKDYRERHQGDAEARVRCPGARDRDWLTEANAPNGVMVDASSTSVPEPLPTALAETLGRILGEALVLQYQRDRAAMGKSPAGIDHTRSRAANP